jgi:hypothetical protein
LSLIALALLFGFTPISRQLLKDVNGSFSPSPFTSLSLVVSSDATSGIRAGALVPVKLTNHMGRTETYHWNATQKGLLISLGENTVDNNRAVTILVPSQGATAGKMSISLVGVNVFVTVPMLKS